MRFAEKTSPFRQREYPVYFHRQFCEEPLGLAKDQNGLLVVEEKPTHRHIANIVGASREMVTRILKKMVADDRIKITGKRIIILNKTL